MKLQPQDWIDAGWLLMASKGVEAVKVEVLARQLKVSKGSFYWHFKNRRDLLEAILQRWEEETKKLIAQSQAAATPKERLIKLFALAEAACQQPDPESAIFQWANKDEAVKQRVRALEIQRVSYLTQLFQKCGFKSNEAKLKAEVAYFAFMGFADRLERDREFKRSMHDFNNFLLAMLLCPINYQLNI